MATSSSSRAGSLVSLLTRRPLDAALDRLRFRVDTFPSLDYQPLPWLNLHSARRAAGTESRWHAIKPLVERLNVRSAVDLGCNVGWFALNLASSGIYTVGVERNPKYYRTFLFAVERLQLQNTALLTLDLNPETTRLLPMSDCVLFLSVWHHLVREHGVAAAAQMVGRIWAKTEKVLFFETGEDEMPPRYGLPLLLPTPAVWIRHLLEGQCQGAVVCHLGEHDAFTPDGHSCRRSLFAAIRRPPVVTS